MTYKDPNRDITHERLERVIGELVQVAFTANLGCDWVSLAGREPAVEDTWSAIYHQGDLIGKLLETWCLTSHPGQVTDIVVRQYFAGLKVLHELCEEADHQADMDCVIRAQSRFMSELHAELNKHRNSAGKLPVWYAEKEEAWRRCLSPKTPV